MPGRRLASLYKSNPRRIKFATLLLASIVTVAAAGFAGQGFGYERGLRQLIADNTPRLELFASNAVLMINRWDRVSATIGLNRDVVSLLRNPHAIDATTVNQYLYRLNSHLGSEAIFIANERGLVVGSSNLTREDDSRLGVDVSYRPYYQDALSGFASRHFALGASAEEPGYFVASPVHEGDRVIGVAVTKASLRPIRDAFLLLGKPALIADANDVVILASDPAWLYSALKPMTVDQRIDLELTGVYGEHSIEPMPFDLALPGDTAARSGSIMISSTARDANGDPLIAQLRPLDDMNWTLLVFSSTGQARWQATVAAALSAVLTCFLLLLAAYVWQWRKIARQRRETRETLERANAELEKVVAKRTTALTDANAELRREMAERIQAEATLRAAQNDLVQAAKLAVLGELATGITHELAQPLGAIQTLAGNAAEFVRRNNLAGVRDNLSMIDSLVKRMGTIIEPLKSFAYKSSAAPECTDIQTAVKNTLFLLDQRIRKADIHVVTQIGRGAVVWCNRNRLEQILINLAANAIDAMDGAPVRNFRITADRRTDGMIAIEITDSGRGLPPDGVEKLFTPFFTTKQAGRGLGLGLAISRGIARDFGGDLSAESNPDGGARFILTLPEPRSEVFA